MRGDGLSSLVSSPHPSQPLYRPSPTKVMVLLTRQVGVGGHLGQGTGLPGDEHIF